MFSDFDPREGKQLQIMGPDGTLNQVPDYIPIMSDDEIIKAYHYILKARTADEWAVSLNRQGRLPTYALNKGQEANSVGAMLALKKDDWFVQAFRELGGLLVRDVPLKQYYLGWLGNEYGFSHDIEKYHILPVSVPIASQMLHLVGLGFAEKYKNNDRIAIGYVGDGGTSEGDFYEAMNFAGVWKTPTIFYVQNNQWAISVPRHTQTATNTIAEKAFSAGIEGIQIDGNDVLSVYAAVKLATEKARKGEGTTLIEGFTYRLGAHTTADDPTRYRDEDQVQKEWGPKDPIVRLEKYLINKKLITQDEIEKLREGYKKEILDAFKEAEKHPATPLEDIYRFQYKELPEVLREQMNELKEVKGVK